MAKVDHNGRAKILKDIGHISFPVLTSLILHGNEITSIDGLPRVDMLQLNYLGLSTSSFEHRRKQNNFSESAAEGELAHAANPLSRQCRIQLPSRCQAPNRGLLPSTRGTLFVFRGRRYGHIG